MIVANITSYIGQCSDAEHFYCKYYNVDLSYNGKLSENLSSINLPLKGIELTRKLSKKEAEILTEKDGWTWRPGQSTNRFDSIEDIHTLLKNKFKKYDIVTYEEGFVYKDMLFIRNGINEGISVFGEIWNTLPFSCYADLLPPKKEIKIKCDCCGKEYQIEDISFEIEISKTRNLFKFLKMYDIPKCCKERNLVWNVVL